jgi:hypothetical protein
MGLLPSGVIMPYGHFQKSMPNVMVLGEVVPLSHQKVAPPGMRVPVITASRPPEKPKEPLSHSTEYNCVDTRGILRSHRTFAF